MPTASESVHVEVRAETQTVRRLYRSSTQHVVAGICGGLGEYFGVDPVWFRVGFVVLALGGGSGILVYLLAWLVIPQAPEDYAPSDMRRGSITGAAVVGVVFMIVGTIALINSIAPWMGQYMWPVVFVMGGLALVLGGLNRDTHR